MSSIAQISTAEPDTLYDLIEHAPVTPGCADRMFRFYSGYQGETDYAVRFSEKRARFRFAKLPWRWSWLKEGERYWNFATRDEFEREMNGNHGLATLGSEPLNEAQLRAFRDEVHAGADTGFFCHIRHRWVRCKPTSREPSRRTWQIMNARDARRK